MNNIAYFENKYKATPTCSISIKDLYLAIKNGRWSNIINNCRSLLNSQSQPNRIGYDKLKSNLPAVTFSGLFTKRNKESLKESSNYVIIDIDGLTSKQLAKTKQKLVSDPHTYLAFISPSEHGIKAIFQASFTNDVTFKIAWKQIAEYLKEKYDIDADSSGKDICRLCYVSYDPEAYFNPDSLEFHIDQEESQETKSLKKFTTVYDLTHFTTLPDEIRKQRYILKVIQNQTLKIKNAKQGERNNTLNIASLIAGQLYWTGYLCKESVKTFFIQAYLSHSGTTEAEALATFNSGWNKGITECKAIPEGGK